MKREYNGIVLTDHAIQRARLRRIRPEMIVQTVKKPENREIEDDGDTKFTKTINGRKVQVIGFYDDDDRKWIVKTMWVRGEDDPSILRKIWVWILGRIGIG